MSRYVLRCVDTETKTITVQHTTADGTPIPLPVGSTAELSAWSSYLDDQIPDQVVSGAAMVVDQVAGEVTATFVPDVDWRRGWVRIIVTAPSFRKTLLSSPMVVSP